MLMLNDWRDRPLRRALNAHVTRLADFCLRFSIQTEPRAPNANVPNAEECSGTVVILSSVICVDQVLGAEAIS